MGGARAASKSEQERRARQQAGIPTREDLGGLERRFKRQQEKILESRTMTEEGKRLALNENRRVFRESWGTMRRQILEQYDADIETARREANPSPSNAELERMGLLANVYLAKWQRTPGNMVADAERFATEGDAAGLRLIREHSGLLNSGSARQAVLEGVGEAQEALMSDAQRQASRQLRSLEGDRSRFELGSGVREGFIRSSTASIGPSSRTPAPASAPQPQR